MDEDSTERISLTCSVCLEGMTPEIQTRTSCGHLFCHNCLTDWINRGNNTCPVCRTQIRTFTTGRTMTRLINHDNLNIPGGYAVNLNIPDGYILVQKKLHILTVLSLIISISSSVMLSIAVVPCYRM